MTSIHNDLPDKEQAFGSSSSTNILRDPVRLSGDELIYDKGFFDRLVAERRSMLVSLGQQADENTQDAARFLVSLYRLRINALMRQEDYQAAYLTLEEFDSWCGDIKTLGTFRPGFDILEVFEDDYKDMHRILNILVNAHNPRKTTVSVAEKDRKTPMRRQKERAVALHGLLLGLERDYLPSPFITEDRNHD